MSHLPSTDAARPLSPPGRKDGEGLDLRPALSGDILASWPDYLIDACQRGVLFLDLLRQRGNEEAEITSRPFATVLSFGHEVLMDGRSLPRPINYTLSRIVPPDGVATDPLKRPVVVVDPRAGQGPGVGPLISTPDSRVSVWVIPTNEELMIAQHTLALIEAQGSNHVQVD